MNPKYADELEITYRDWCHGDELVSIEYSRVFFSFEELPTTWGDGKEYNPFGPGCIALLLLSPLPFSGWMTHGVKYYGVEVLLTTSNRTTARGWVWANAFKKL